jgi:hypothetical protein
MFSASDSFAQRRRDAADTLKTKANQEMKKAGEEAEQIDTTLREEMKQGAEKAVEDLDQKVKKGKEMKGKGKK